MDQLFVLVVLTVLGLGLGSFAGATVWRLRARQLKEDKAAGEKVSREELKQLQPLNEATFSTDRSRCLHCHHVLAWYDLIPLISWISTGGRCRYCGARIGWLEPAAEIGVAVSFILSYLLWPTTLNSPPEVAQFILWLASIVCLAILFFYDLRWYLLPNAAMFPLLTLAVLSMLIEVVMTDNITSTILSIIFAAMVLSGLYLLLWVVSRGRWIGFGDVKLGLALALFLIDWRLAFVALFAANLIGCLLVLPGLLQGKLTRSTRVPFGPLLIVGGLGAMLVGPQIVDWYMAILL